MSWLLPIIAVLLLVIFRDLWYSTSNRREFRELTSFPVRTLTNATHQDLSFPVLVINVTADGTCPAKFGYFPDPADCQGYFICTFGNAKPRRCGTGLHYKTTTQTCDKPSGDCTQDGDQATRPKYTGPMMKTGNAPPQTAAALATSAPTEAAPSDQQAPTQLATQTSVDQQYSPNANNPDDQQGQSAVNNPPQPGNVKQMSKNADFSALTNRNSGRDAAFVPKSVTETTAVNTVKKPSFTQMNVKPSFNKPDFSKPAPQNLNPGDKPSATVKTPVKSSYSDAVKLAFNSKPSFGGKKKVPVQPIPPPPTAAAPPAPLPDRDNNPPPEQPKQDVSDGRTGDVNTNDQNADNAPPPMAPRPLIPKTFQPRPAAANNRNPDGNSWGQDTPPAQPNRGSDRWSPKNQNDQSGQDAPDDQQSQDGDGRGRSRPAFAASQIDQQPVDNAIKRPVNNRKPQRPPPLSRERNRAPPEAISQPADQSASQCSADVCQLPNCMCGGTGIPNKMQIAEVPQMVLLSFDAEINERNLPIYEQIFHKNRKNPNGCNLKATFFVSHEFTNYGMVRYLYEKGHEIGSHSITHGVGTGFKDERAWETEMTGEKGFLASFASIRPDDIKGARAPLLGGGGDDQFQALVNGQFTYDSTLVTPTSSKAPYWPYTLDYGVPHACVQPPCPQQTYAGLWELPLNPIYGLFGENCYEADRCTFGSTGNEVYKLMYSNFYDKHYSTNKAPFHLAIHADWLKYPPHREAFERFLDLVATMPDVWVVTGSQAVAWMQNPTPLSQLTSFAPWQCSADDASRLPQCDTINACPLTFRNRLRYFYTCSECPAEFPWRPEAK
ncbi:uncharacterized protein LOC129586352 [Paramacrobiotus metropolitanus]|uniref:uncharacterized protein LOC129586352 n=1 Tax=Paramacrobiotus metropolitanus TaxID=2943436 RepID=UPI0024460BEC|nr:uncharacterized protein LOC129586352 [Paramacrobiotus metropolitanus]